MVEECKGHYKFEKIFLLLYLQWCHKIHWYFWCPMTISIYEWTLLGDGRKYLITTLVCMYSLHSKVIELRMRNEEEVIKLRTKDQK